MFMHHDQCIAFVKQLVSITKSERMKRRDLGVTISRRVKSWERSDLLLEPFNEEIWRREKDGEEEELVVKKKSW